MRSLRAILCVSARYIIPWIYRCFQVLTIPKAFNERVQYYAQLQSISDSLREAEWTGAVDEAITASNALQAELDGKIKTGKARERYVRLISHPSPFLSRSDSLPNSFNILQRKEMTKKRAAFSVAAYAFVSHSFVSWRSLIGLR